MSFLRFKKGWFIHCPFSQLIRLHCWPFIIRIFSISLQREGGGEEEEALSFAKIMTMAKRSHGRFYRLCWILFPPWWDALQVPFLAGDARNDMQVGRKAVHVLAQRLAPTGNKFEIQILPYFLPAQRSRRIAHFLKSTAENSSLFFSFRAKGSQKWKKRFPSFVLTHLQHWFEFLEIEREEQNGKWIYSRFLKVDGVCQHMRLPTRLPRYWIINKFQGTFCHFFVYWAKVASFSLCAFLCLCWFLLMDLYLFSLSVSSQWWGSMMRISACLANFLLRFLSGTCY